MSSSRSSFVVLSAFLFVCVLALLTGPSIDGLRIRRRLSSSQVAEVNAIPSKNILANVSYSQLQEAVITEYFASHPDETDIEVQFDDALGAMQMVEIDGKPVPINSVDGLYVGSIGAANNLPGLHKEGITHILSLTDSGPCKHPDLFNCLHIDGLSDNSDPENRISQYFDTTLPFIRNALESGGRVLVHCYMGKSRSVATIAAYLIETNHLSPEDALTLIRVTRPFAKPNHGYMEELQDFYEEQVITGTRHLN